MPKSLKEICLFITSQKPCSVRMKFNGKLDEVPEIQTRI